MTDRTERTEPDDCPADLIPTRKSLLGRLKDWQDNESCQDFFDTYWKLIYGFAIKRGLTHPGRRRRSRKPSWLWPKASLGLNIIRTDCSFNIWLLSITQSKIMIFESFSRCAPIP